MAGICNTRYNKESLLHVAAYASIRYNSAVSVRLVAMMLCPRW